VRIETGPNAAQWRRLEEPGAYEWWYFDALDAERSLALVVIWFAAFPFSPSYLEAYERGREPSPADHPAMFVALYGESGLLAYALDTYARNDFEGLESDGQMRVGSKLLSTDAAGRTRMMLDLPALLDDPPLFRRGRIKGEVEVVPVGELLSVESHGSGEHVWNPIAPRCGVTATIVVTDGAGKATATSFEGVGYADHNYGSRPLTSGIERWHWGRVHFDEQTDVIYYHTSLTGTRSTSWLSYRDSERQSCGEASFDPEAWRRRPFCPRYPTKLRVSRDDVEIRTRVVRVLDWGPFYMRFLTEFEATTPGSTRRALGISEYLDPRGLRRRFYRPLIRTRIKKGNG